ncbi:MAG: TldD/PmbA family protein, partial [Candidatus Gracilibacteria bacterium]|nr:TldD/PmbA family protein [Candidatus Gracilibacteria bacterium]
NACEKLNKVLNGIPSPSGNMDVIIGNEAGGTIIHEAIGHGLEADMLNSSVYRDKLGQQVASNFVNIIDEPVRDNLRGSYAFDHEGRESKKTYLIKNGILVSYLHSNKTAALFETESTGHARREAYYCPTLVRMGNTYLDKGTSKKEEIISKIRNGIYVSQMGGGQVNTVTGDFVFKVSYGYLIKDGKLTDIIRGANISGNGPQMLQNIKAICDDLEHFDGGTCGKGQSMPVSDATPTIWVKLKVTGIK